MKKHKKLRGLDELLILPRKSNKIVVTTGAFDVPHKAHRIYLNKARTFGNILIVILQSDEFIKARKGDGRPIRNENVRVRRLSSCSYNFVDYIVIANDLENFYNLISMLNPNILVVSETTTDDETCPATMKRLFDKKIKIKVLPAQSELHSSDIIKRRNLVKRKPT